MAPIKFFQNPQQITNIYFLRMIKTSDIQIPISHCQLQLRIKQSILFRVQKLTNPCEQVKQTLIWYICSWGCSIILDKMSFKQHFPYSHMSSQTVRKTPGEKDHLFVNAGFLWSSQTSLELAATMSDSKDLNIHYSIIMAFKYLSIRSFKVSFILE